MRVDAFAYLRQVADVHLHATALAGAVQPLHVDVERPTDTGRLSEIREITSDCTTVSTEVSLILTCH